MANQIDVTVDQQRDESIGESAQHVETKQKQQIYREIAQMASFKKLVRKKKTFLFSTTILFLMAYITLPILTSFTTVLEHRVVGKITWVWVYSLSLFVMTIVLCEVYKGRASKYDKEVAKILKEYEDNK
ncbi:DUF485 domain-containing protein [Kurthia massiliensis]|uniref:DUF485 domain-containing protein n=1 Tax=Kurthia massiliensis TaxID=1033739 RepID=UPI0002893701|nr:DUF485 domain-containing protein [Kurthia massiliensis]